MKIEDTVNEILKFLNVAIGETDAVAVEEIIDKYVKEQLIKDREKLFGEIAQQLWDVNESIYSENEDHDYAIGYDENGIPNSVSLEIYGRTHSELSFTSPEIE